MLLQFCVMNALQISQLIGNIVEEGMNRGNNRASPLSANLGVLGWLGMIETFLAGMRALSIQLAERDGQKSSK